MRERLLESREAALALGRLTTEEKNQALACLADLLKEYEEDLVHANQKDLEEGKELDKPLFDRLTLDSKKIQTLIEGIRDVQNLEDPVGRVTLESEPQSGIALRRVSVPIGVLGIIFESRPDAVPQILSLTLKSGNAAVLKGGKEATHTLRAFGDMLRELPERAPNVPKAWAQFIETHADVDELIQHPDLVDMVIPRGSNALVSSIMERSQIPVLGHADGICHVYVHEKANLTAAVQIALNSKTQYPAACNALETLLVDEALAGEFLPKFEEAAQGVELRACERSLQFLKDAKAAEEEDFGKEFGNLTLAIKTVTGVREAIDHINTKGSGHTDAILSENPGVCEQFLAEVDSACVFCNASTRFADGFRMGFGAEVGISTSRTHARGPVGLEGLVIYKYQLRGQGQIVHG